ncbi:hypothetical protein F5Y16DRAFT_250380 [Xylariaceae sp. FL0255]|nr:hypothetical protein F5Y16DRAFT_250380 [Xylariaceae sp. FL0255]
MEMTSSYYSNRDRSSDEVNDRLLRDDLKEDDGSLSTSSTLDVLKSRRRAEKRRRWCLPALVLVHLGFILSYSAVFLGLVLFVLRGSGISAVRDNEQAIDSPMGTVNLPFNAGKPHSSSSSPIHSSSGNSPEPVLEGHWKKENKPDEDKYVPIREALRYEDRTVNFDFNTVNRFKGPTVKEVDRAWLQLLNGGHELRMSKEEVARAGLETVDLEDGSGDQIVLSTTYHMLHCIYVLYQLNHPEFYGVDPGLVPQDIHVDHCVDNLRQYLMCHATDSLMTFVWREDTPRPYPALDTTETCVDWDYYDKWTRAHSLSKSELVNLEADSNGEALFHHPTFGTVTPAMYNNVTRQDLGYPPRKPQKLNCDVD